MAETAYHPVPTQTSRLPVGRRLDRLSDRARDIVDLAAVLGRSFRLADLSSLLDRPVTHLVTEVRELFTAGLFVEDGREPAFPHEHVRRVVLDRLPETLSRALNRDVALHMLASGSPAADLAPYVLAGMNAHERATAGLREVVEQLELAAPGGAAEAYQRALDFAGTGSRQWASLVAPTARALTYGGRLDDAQALLATALGQVDPTAGAAIRLALAEVLGLRGRNREVIDVLGAVTDDVDPPTRSYVRMRSAYAGLHLPDGDPADAPAAAEHVVVTARSVGDHPAWCDGLVTGSIVLRLLGDLGGSLRRATEATLVARHEPATRAHDPRVWRARTLCALDRLDEAEVLCDQVFDDISRHGNIAMLPVLHATRARVLLAGEPEPGRDRSASRPPARRGSGGRRRGGHPHRRRPVRVGRTAPGHGDGPRGRRDAGRGAAVTLGGRRRRDGQVGIGRSGRTGRPGSFGVPSAMGSTGDPGGAVARWPAGPV